jgi:hemerythrin-like domain-containing protein
MSVQIGARPDSGFDDPLGMLQDCHRRIERFLQVLTRVAGRALGRALDAEEAAAVEAALHYFRTGGARHTADEEESLFPRLRACAQAPADTVGDLQHQHQRADILHAEIDLLFTAWLNLHALSPDQQQQLHAATAELEQLYAGHIELEERVVFPAAAQLLTRQELVEIGNELRDRRA